MKNHIHNARVTLTPSEEQKTRMLKEIHAQIDASQRNDRMDSPIQRRMFVPAAAMVMMLVLSATAYASIDGNVVSLIKNGYS
ncbi:hypothetical protein [Paenibacillus naphthalenovorans]|uniref:Uncharacterized protein n=1 Tax=Paenibacillus naphthalenovorans TaxID=162209 RepID=A0A0U2WFC9_9BACL|nr:hypothetical protein [Paenibacillus naphthalenovorans]ALS25070.1 hypothetical protein IJ22_48080 [Paenibacillus naphthalenovorans]GCL74787.1 hypothetical protein PN4B1_47690 [Paenibacillus naphthalenovorans]